jgi:flagellar motor switch protein FliG
MTTSIGSGITTSIGAAPGRPLTGREKAAAMLAQMTDEQVASIMRSMSDIEVVDLMAAMAKLPPLQTEIVNEVVGDFLRTLVALHSVGQGGLDAARKILQARMGAQRAEEVLRSLEDQDPGGPFNFLNAIDPQQVATFLAEEHPQTIATVLAHLPASDGAAVLDQIGEDLRVDIARRIATTRRASPEVLRDMAAILEEKLSMLSERRNTAGRGIESLVDILNHADRSSEKQILSTLEETDPDLAEEVRNLLFVFDDIIALDDRSLQKVLRNVAPKDLAVALKGTSAEVKEKFVRNMSERAAADLAEEMEVLGPTRLETVEASQAELVKRVRELEAAGEIVLVRANDELVE